MSLAVQVVFDCHDADVMADFWAKALEYVLEPPPAGFDTWETFLDANGIPLPEPGSISAVVDPAGVGRRLFFRRVPDPTPGKNRVHIDLAAEDPEAEVGRLVGLGAELVDERVNGRPAWREANGIPWVVLRDPEGNEFCIGFG